MRAVFLCKPFARRIMGLLSAALLLSGVVAWRNYSQADPPVADPAGADPAEADVAAGDAPSVEGIWDGTLKVPGVELRVLFKIKREEGGKFSATMDSVTQGVKGIPVSSVTQEGRRVVLEAKAIAGVFEGELNEQGTELAGTWKQAGQSLPLALVRLEREPDLSRPQDPKKPYPYREEEVLFENAQDRVRLAGTLTLPEGKGPFPAVVFITGSGAQDRDEALMGHRPFLVLADHLTRRGIAVLRYDDRGVGGSTGSVFAATLEDTVGDVEAAMALLRSRPEIDAKKIGLLGHSEGGIVAPLAASRSPEVAFVVMLAGTGVSGEEILISQGGLVPAAEGADKQTVEKSLAAQRRALEILKSEKDPAALQEKLRAALEEELHTLIASQGLSEEAAKSMIEAQVQVVSTPWFQSFLHYDPRPALRQVKCPVLALNGERDVQVDPKLNLPEIEKALREGGNTAATVKELPGLNHLFQTCQTGAVSEYGKIEETMAPAVLEMISDWILQHTR
jgi:pimeloyl-ACP methyl ester carboxylesterase